MHEQKTVLVIGGAGGIGQATVEFFLAQGFAVHATYHQDRPRDEVRDVLWYQCDITNTASVEKLFLALKESRLSTVINAATGPLDLAPFPALNERVIERDMEICYFGAIEVTRHAIELLREEGGTIIHLLSAAIEHPSARMLSYTAAKSALKTVIVGLGPSLKDQGIRLIGLSPSYVETRLLDAFPAKLLEIERAKSGGSLLSPREVAETLLKIAEGELGDSGNHFVLTKDEAGKLKIENK